MGQSTVEAAIGLRVRRLRKARGLTLDALSELTGVSKSVLSKIENGKVSSPISTFSRICSALDVSLGDLFSDDGAGDPLVVRKGEGRLLSRMGTPFGYVYYSLAHPRAGRRMAPFLLIYPHHLKKTPTFSHAGEEFLFVLKGRLEFVYGDRTLILKEGDSLYLDPQVEHGARALDGRVCETLVISTV